MDESKYAGNMISNVSIPDEQEFLKVPSPEGYYSNNMAGTQTKMTHSETGQLYFFFSFTFGRNGSPRKSIPLIL